MKKINILLLGVSGNVTQGILSCIRRNHIDSYVVGACIFPDSIGQYMVDEFLVSPYANDKNFIPWLIDVCEKKKIDIVLSGTEENIAAISHFLPQIQKQIKTKFIVATPEQLQIGNDKLKTCQWLKENNCNYPLYADAQNSQELEDLIKAVSFPLIAKPRNGKGSSGIKIIHKQEDLFEVQKLENYIIEEYLGDKDSEYTVAVYSDKNAIFQNMIILKRQLQNGTTVLAEVVEDKDIYQECLKIATHLKIKGPLNIQLRMHHGRPVCFELNIRFSGTTPLRDLLGFHDLYAAIKEYLVDEAPAEYLCYRKGKVIRLTTEKLITEGK